MPEVLIAGGGSGGHVAPAIAVAEALQSEGTGVILVHSSRSIDQEMLSSSPFYHQAISASPLRLSPTGLLSFCNSFIKATNETKELIKKHDVRCVLSTGGFVAAPALKAANKLGVHTILLNLDNPPGKANRLATRWANEKLTTVACDWPDARMIAPPIRRASLEHPKPEICKQQLNLDPRLSTLLVTGASQGAKTVNELVLALANSFPQSFKGWQVLHIAGEQNKLEVSKLWQQLNVPVVVTGFIHEMGVAWGAADLAITRGGANTIAEIAFHAVPTVVLPYPFHKDDHQRTNALPLAEIKGIVLAHDYRLAEKNLEEVGLVIKQLLGDHMARLQMRQALTSLGQTNGAQCIAELCSACV